MHSNCILDSVANLLVRHMVFVGNVQKSAEDAENQENNKQHVLDRGIIMQFWKNHIFCKMTNSYKTKAMQAAYPPGLIMLIQQPNIPNHFANFRFIHTHFYCQTQSETCSKSKITLSFFLPVRLNLCRGHQTGFGIQVQKVGGWWWWRGGGVVE